MKQFFFLALLSVSLIVFTMAFVKKETAPDDKHLEIVLRNIGHQLLLRSKDSTSRVLPIKAIDENTFQISFQNKFGFIPDTLMNVVHEQLAKSGRLGDYTVSVKECDKNHTVFAYEENTATGDLKPCKGRAHQVGCYLIEISFLTNQSFNYAWLLLTLIPIGLAGIYFMRTRKNIPVSEKSLQEIPAETISAENIATEYKKLGNFLFFESKGVLQHENETVELSVKEAKALSMLISNMHQVVERELLMKKIWEDDGVVVITRNVDVLISKLRKRLSADPSVKIVNVPGKGYKMVC